MLNFDRILAGDKTSWGWIFNFPVVVICDSAFLYIEVLILKRKRIPQFLDFFHNLAICLYIFPMVDGRAFIIIQRRQDMNLRYAETEVKM